jgi:hypothetical protein
MKKIIIPIVALSIFSLSSCKKCYECKAEIPVYEKQVKVGTETDIQEFCDKGAKAKVNKTAMEQTGYKCTSK